MHATNDTNRPAAFARPPTAPRSHSLSNSCRPSPMPFTAFRGPRACSVCHFAQDRGLAVLPFFRLFFGQLADAVSGGALSVLRARSGRTTPRQCRTSPRHWPILNRRARRAASARGSAVRRPAPPSSRSASRDPLLPLIRIRSGTFMDVLCGVVHPVQEKPCKKGRSLTEMNRPSSIEAALEGRSISFLATIGMWPSTGR